MKRKKALKYAIKKLNKMNRLASAAASCFDIISIAGEKVAGFRKPHGEQCVDAIGDVYEVPQREDHDDTD